MPIKTSFIFHDIRYNRSFMYFVLMIFVYLAHFPHILNAERAQENNSQYWNPQDISEAQPPQLIVLPVWAVNNTKYSNNGYGILFTYASNIDERDIYVATDLDHWRRHKMQKNKHGIAYFLYSLTNEDLLLSNKNSDLLYVEAKNILYKFQVNGIWIVDPKNPNSNLDNYQQMRSLMILNYRDFNWQSIALHPISSTVSGRVNFHAYLPKANSVFLVGDFNNWFVDTNNSTQYKFSTNGQGYFWFTTELLPGKYTYLFLVEEQGKGMRYQRDLSNQFTHYVRELNVQCSVANIK